MLIFSYLFSCLHCTTRRGCLLLNTRKAEGMGVASRCYCNSKPSAPHREPAARGSSPTLHILVWRAWVLRTHAYQPMRKGWESNPQTAFTRLRFSKPLAYHSPHPSLIRRRRTGEQLRGNCFSLCALPYHVARSESRFFFLHSNRAQG